MEIDSSCRLIAKSVPNDLITDVTHRPEGSCNSGLLSAQTSRSTLWVRDVLPKDTPALASDLLGKSCKCRDDVHMRQL
jgi:hypothetical protein